MTRMQGPRLSRLELDHLLIEAADGRLFTDQGTSDEIDMILERVAAKGRIDREDRHEAHGHRRELPSY